MYQLCGTKTFRRGSRKILGRWGDNSQNFSKDIREIMESDGLTPELYEKCSYWLQTGDTSIFTEQELLELKVMLQVDQSGAEALIVAYDCEPLDYRKLFIHNVKPHVYVALKLFKDEWSRKASESGLSITADEIDRLYMTKIEHLRDNPFWKELDTLIKSSDEWPAEERYYYFAKQTVHSANYSIQWSTFIGNVLHKSQGAVVLSKEQGIYFLQTYRSLFPEIVDRANRVVRQAKDIRILYNMLGFPYIITDYELPSTREKELIAWGPQSTVGEITRIAFTMLQSYIELNKLDWDILQDNHDSYLAQCPLRDIKHCVTTMQKFMNQELISPIDGAKFSMRSEYGVGFNWSSRKEKNKLGLGELKWL